MATREEIATFSRVHVVRGPPDAAAARGRGHLRGGLLPARRADPPPGADRTGFSVILEGNADVRSTGRSGRARTAATSSARSRSCSGAADRGRRRRHALRCLADRPHAPSRASSSCTRRSCTGCSRPGAWTPQRQPLAELAMATHIRVPSRPGNTRSIVIGAGPGGLQVSPGSEPTASRARRPVLATPSPSGMFRQSPFFQRLLSSTKPYAPEERISRETSGTTGTAWSTFEPELRSLRPRSWTAVVLPVAARDGGQPRRRAEQAGIAVRYECTLGAHPAKVTDRTARRSSSRPRMASTHAVLVLAVASRSRGRPRRRDRAARRYAETREASCVRRQADVHHRQAELGLRARLGARGLGV